MSQAPHLDVTVRVYGACHWFVWWTVEITFRFRANLGDGFNVQSLVV